MSTRTEHFLETSALVDLEFRSPLMRQHVLAQLPATPELRTSHYVLFELSRGFLRHLLILHNKAADLNSMADLMQYVKNRGIYANYPGQTMQGAHIDFLRKLEEDALPLTESQRLLHFRAWLGALIRQGWRRLKRRYPLVNPIGCRDDLPTPTPRAVPHTTPRREHLHHDLPTEHCGSVGNCALITTLQTATPNFRAMETHLHTLPRPDVETQRRLAALPRLLDHPAGSPFDRKDCFDCGDAIIAHEGAESLAVVSKNEKHLRPLCDAIGHTLVSYKEPPSASAP